MEKFCNCEYCGAEICEDEDMIFLDYDVPLHKECAEEAL